MKINRESIIHEKAIRLIQGEIVEINGHYVVAVEVKKLVPCVVCKIESECDFDMTDLCGECEAITRKRYMLKFANVKTNN